MPTASFTLIIPTREMEQTKTDLTLSQNITSLGDSQSPIMDNNQLSLYGSHVKANGRSERAVMFSVETKLLLSLLMFFIKVNI